MSTLSQTEKYFILIGSLILIAFGLSIMLAWHLEQLAFWRQLEGAKVPVYFSTAICFTLSGVGFLLKVFPSDKINPLQFSIGFILFIFSGLILAEHLFNFNVNFEKIFTLQDIQKDQLYPNRMTINACISFILTGLVLMLLTLKTTRMIPIICQILIFLIFFIGFFGVLLYLFRLDFVVSWATYTRIALRSSLGFILISLLAWITLSKLDIQDTDNTNQARKISISMGEILLSIALLLSIGNFAIFIHQNEIQIKSFLKSELTDQLLILNKELKDAIQRIELGLSKKGMLLLKNGEFQNLGEDFLSHGFTGVNFSNAQKGVNETVGTTIDTPTGKMQLDKKHEMQLIWKEAFFVELHKEIKIDNENTVKIKAFYPLHSLTQLFFSERKKSDEFFLCSKHADNKANCASSKTFPNLLQLNTAEETLPIHQALLGRTGTTIAKDYKKREVIAAYAPLGDIGENIGLVYKMDYLEFITPVLKRLLWILPIFLLAILFGVVLLFYQVLPLIKLIIKSEKLSTQLKGEAEKKEKYINTVVNTISEGLVTLSEKGVIRTVNLKMIKLFKYKPEELIGIPISSLIPELMGNFEKNILTELYAQKKGEEETTELTGLRVDGTTFPLELSISEFFSDDEHLFTVTIRDISDKKETEEKIKRLAAIVESSVDAIITIDADKKISSWNEGAEKLYGFSRGEVIGKPIHLIIPKEQQNTTNKVIEQVKKGEKISNFETERRHKNGELIPVSITVFPLTDKDGNVTSISSIQRNISDRKKIDKMKNEFISTVSHELRTPLTSIQGSLSLLIGGAVGLIPDKALTLLKIASQNSQRLIRLINDILDVEKIESGKMEFKISRHNVTQIVEEAVQMNEAFATKYNVNLVLEKNNEESNANVDRDKLIQVLTNLISNAIKFSPPDQQVVVKIKHLEKKIRVSVSDKGPGIPPEFQEKIFQKFAQADSSTRREKGGTGLGLSISKAIIEKLQGNIGYETVLNQGTTFYFDLPLIDSKETFKKAYQKSSTILICDSDKEAANFIKEGFEREGLETIIIKTIEETNVFLETHSIDTLIINLSAQEEKGIALIKKLRANPKTLHLPILISSYKVKPEQNELIGNAISIVDWIDQKNDSHRLLNAINAIKKKIDLNSPRILHVEDDLDLLQTVATLLQKEANLDVVTTLKDAKIAISQQKYDLVILDIKLPDGYTFELLPELSKRHLPVVIFTAFELPNEYTQYVVKILIKSKTSIEELLKTVKSTLK